MTSLARVASDRFQSGATVLILQEADELLALSAAEAAAGICQPIKIVSGSDPEVMGMIDNHKSGEGTMILSDFLAIFGENAVAVRLVREVSLQQRPEDEAFSRLILIEQPFTTIPPALVGDVEVIPSPLPGVDELLLELDEFVEGQNINLPENGDTRFNLAASVAGLPRHEAARLFARSHIENKGLDASWLRTEKARRVSTKLAGALSFESTDGADVGGLDSLKTWLRLRRASFASSKAREYGLPEPKGLLLVGIPGCGKSLTAKTVAREWELPLLRLDAGRLFGSLVGQSESQTRQAIEAAEACAPCVLWIDEIEKGLAGGGGGGSSDSGTTQRVFGTLLTWLQEKTAPVFVVATANQIAGIPPELLRKGRFDEIFFIGLPDVGEREEIAKIHLSRRGRKTAMAKKIASVTEGFGGAEIEQAIVEGLFFSFAADRDLQAQDVLEAVRNTSPLSKTMVERIKALEAWAAGRARNASNAKINTPSKPRARRRGPSITK